MPLLALLATTLLAPLPQAPDRIDQVTIEGRFGILHVVRELDLDVVARRSLDGGLQEVDVLVDAADRELLERAGLPHRTAIRDVPAFYRSRFSEVQLPAGSLGSTLSPPFAGGGIGGYYTYAEMVAVFDQVAAAHPGIVAPKVSLGTTVEGEDIWAWKVSDNPGTDEAEPEVRIDAMHHPREMMSAHSVLWFLLHLTEEYGNDPLATHLVDERELWFVPVVNPDGMLFNEVDEPGGGGLWRKNRRDNGDASFGVDLNRNYGFQWGLDDLGSSPIPESEIYRGPAPISEPETQAMDAFMAARSFDLAISVHSFSNVLIHPWGYTQDLIPEFQNYVALSTHATEVNGYDIGTVVQTLNYTVNGVTADHEEGFYGTYSVSPEVGSASDGFWPATSRMVPIAEDTLAMYQRLCLAADVSVVVDGIAPTDAGDGDGFPEPGETVALDVDLRNVGIAGGGAPIELDVAVLGPHASVVGGPTSVPALASLGAASAAAPGVSIHANAPAGAIVDLELLVNAEGWTQRIPVAIDVGVPRTLVRDDVELDRGWTAGVPGDDAQTGLWERGDPIGTFTGTGEPASPSLDSTPDPGVLCWTTGNGGESAGTDDVDDGETTLLSPPFDLAGLATARVSYARWYALLSEQDDAFEVALSNDGGDTWTVLEQVDRNENAWRTVSFRAEQVLPLTDRMQLRFVAEDDPNNSIVEAAVDDLIVETFDTAPRLTLYGAPLLGGLAQLGVNGSVGAAYGLYVAVGAGQLAFPGIGGELLLDPGTTTLVTLGLLDPSGAALLDVPLPTNPAWSGNELHLQGLHFDGASFAFTNAASLAFP